MFGVLANNTKYQRNSFVNEKINARKLLQEAYEFLKEGKTSEEKKRAECCDYLIQLLRKNEKL